MIATRRDAAELFHRGAIALARVESAGIAIDVGYLEKTIEKISGKVAALTEKIRNDEIFRVWRKRFGEKTNPGSHAQLGEVLFKILKYDAPGQTRTGRDKTDEAALATVDLPFVREWLQCEKLKKLNATYLKGVQREVVNGLLHAVYNEHLTVTYRLSSDTPNFQNIPIRDPEIGKYIRRAFVPRPGRVLVEVDFKGAEVCIAACYNQDPTLIKYITDLTRDMHRDMAVQIFKCRESDTPKPLRNLVKGNFVFAEFYGSWYKNCAPNLWTEAATIPGVLDRLEKKTGITELGECRLPENGKFFDPIPGTFEHHLYEIEKDFWGRRFRGYADWKKSWYAEYQGRGYFDMLTGFRCAGVYSKNEAVNYPIQGAAAHCLLWALIELNDWLRKHKMKSLIVGTIHDSMLLDCTEKELADVLGKVHRLITRSLPRAWRWICVPLSVEIEGSRETWFDKKPLAI